jgi:hypothetical protein
MNQVSFDEKLVKRMIEEAVKQEREACAKIVDENIGFENYLSALIREREYSNDTSLERVDLIGENKHD